MRYELLNATISADTQIFEIENIPAETDDKGQVTKEAETKQTPTDKYFVSISLQIKDNDSEAGPFFRSVEVESHNSQTGFEVDAVRKKAVENFMKELNS